VNVVLGVSRQRVNQLIETGQLESIQFAGHHYITKESLVAYANSERKAGRPLKADTMTKAESWKAAVEVAHRK
jgi:hypothetical protein